MYNDSHPLVSYYCATPFSSDVPASVLVTAESVLACWSLWVDASHASVQLQASFNSPRIRAVVKRDNMQAGLFKVFNKKDGQWLLSTHLRYNNAGCALPKTCMTVIVVLSPVIYANNVAKKYGFLNGAGGVAFIQR
jgi:hypothetical protein